MWTWDGFLLVVDWQQWQPNNSLQYFDYLFIYTFLNTLEANVSEVYNGYVYMDPWVPEFINRFDDTQKNATRASLPITDDWLAAMDTSALVTANDFPNDFPAWDGLVPSD